VRARRPNGGFSLPEILVATFMASIALTSLVSFAAAQRRGFCLIQERIAANQTLRLALEMLGRDLRRAGFDARGTAVEPVAAAGSTTLSLQQDDDGDGVIDSGSEESITYAFRPAVGTLSRVVGSQSMPLATGLPPDGFQLSYMDADGTQLDAAGRDLDAAERARIRRIRAALLARDAGGEALASAVVEAALRNRPWTP